MSKRLILPAVLILGIWTVLNGATAFGDDKSRAPAIHDSFAARNMSPYDTWKVYLHATDPSGEMRYIFAVVDQPGAGESPVSIIRIKPGNRKDLSGYVYLTTFGPSTSLLNFAEVRLTIWIRDSSGNFSEPASFSLTLNTRYTQESPPSGKFKEQDLGPIMIRLHPVAESS